MRVICTECGVGFRTAQEEAAVDKLQCSQCGGKLRKLHSHRHRRRPSACLRRMAEAARPGGALLERLQCPNCWHAFAPEGILWVAEGEALRPDTLLEEEPLRFLPSRFTPAGMAIDLEGQPCRQLACPHCHLPIPRDLLSLRPLFLSIVGAPSCGKSYQLSAMSYRLREILPSLFGITFRDADPTANTLLNQYEETVFVNPENRELVALDKTELEGRRWYNAVDIGGRPVVLPRPFTFSLRPMERHPEFRRARELSLAAVLYDNAGEHFQPSADATAQTATHHVAHSDAILFIFDPIQDRRFRAECDGDDPQLSGLGRIHRPARQDLLVHEMATRIRNLLGLSAHDLHAKPLIVIVSKYDIWRNLLREPLPQVPYARNPATGLCELDTVEIDNISLEVRELLRRLCPDFVGAVESFCQRVRFIPTSAHGCSPVVNEAMRAETAGGEAGPALAVRAADIRPVWAEVPMLYILAKRAASLLPATRQAPMREMPRPAAVRRLAHRFLVTPRAGEEPLEIPADYAGQVVRIPATGEEFFLDP